MSDLTRIPNGRLQLAQVVASAGDLISIADVERTLQLGRTEAAKRLSRWTAQGWLHRVSSGIYAPVGIDMLGTHQVLEDPWVLVPVLFAPGYIGGRTASEHWDLTEQVFKDIVVVTAQTIRQTRQLRHGTTFTLRHVSEEKLFGTKTVWRKRSRVQISDVHRTIIDMLDEPALGAGIQHVADCFGAYLRRPDREDRRLMDYAARLGNGAVFKRLGFLAERLGDKSSLIETCRDHLSAGATKLDPSSQNGHFVARWRLYVPENWTVSRTQ